MKVNLPSLLAAKMWLNDRTPMVDIGKEEGLISNYLHKFCNFARQLKRGGCLFKARTLRM